MRGAKGGIEGAEKGDSVYFIMQASSLVPERSLPFRTDWQGSGGCTRTAVCPHGAAGSSAGMSCRPLRSRSGCILKKNASTVLVLKLILRPNTNKPSVEEPRVMQLA